MWVEGLVIIGDVLLLGQQTSQYGGIGIHASFKNSCLNWYVGSTPTIGTKYKIWMVNMHRVLIVDDDECIKNLLVIWVKQLGVFDEVDYAFDGETALELFEKHKYDLVILDVGLMTMSGVEVCMEMREWDKNVKIVALTGYERLATECDMTVAGFNKIYIKPDGFKELMDDIKDEVFKKIT